MLVFVNLIIEPEALEGKSARLRSLRPVVIPPSQKLMRQWRGPSSGHTKAGFSLQGT